MQSWMQKKKKKNILLQNNAQFRELLDSSNWTRRYLLLISNTINEFFPSIPLSKFGRRQGEIAKIVTFFVVILYDSLSLSFFLILTHSLTHSLIHSLFLLSSFEHTRFLYIHQRHILFYFNRSFSILQLAISGKEAWREETPFLLLN